MTSVEETNPRNKETSSAKIVNENFSNNEKISKLKRHTHVLSKNYDLTIYLNPNMFTFSEEIAELIPRDTPAYLDNGEHYV